MAYQVPGAWGEHPKLKGRVDPHRPDCLQVIVHDGGPRTSKHRPELMWVRITGYESDVFSGVLLGHPSGLENLTEGSEIRFVVPSSGQHPIRVTEKYLEERPHWRLLAPCNKCGLSELFDAPSDLLRATFPGLGQAMSVFTVICGWCGGTLVIRLRQDRTKR